ncbi:MAG: hypothetical protein ABJC26_12230 [Gemmatimonadaceae bacterium]
MRIREDGIDQITGFASVCECHQFVDREVDRVEHDTATCHRHKWEKAPRRFVRPIQNRGLAIAPRSGAYKPAMLSENDHFVACGAQRAGIGGERLIRCIGRTMKEIESVAEALTIGAQVKRGPARQIMKRLNGCGRYL